jgi:hypothetical protein
MVHVHVRQPLSPSPWLLSPLTFLLDFWIDVMSVPTVPHKAAFIHPNLWCKIVILNPLTMQLNVALSARYRFAKIKKLGLFGDGGACEDGCEMVLSVSWLTLLMALFSVLPSPRYLSSFSHCFSLATSCEPLPWGDHCASIIMEGDNFGSWLQDLGGNGYPPSPPPSPLSPILPC